MNWQTVADFILAHPIFCILLPALIGMQLALMLIAFHTCGCEQCGKPYGIWRCRDQALELCYKCYKGRLPERRKLLARSSAREPSTQITQRTASQSAR